MTPREVLTAHHLSDCRADYIAKCINAMQPVDPEWLPGIGMREQAKADAIRDLAALVAAGYQVCAPGEANIDGERKRLERRVLTEDARLIRPTGGVWHASFDYERCYVALPLSDTEGSEG